MTADIRPHLRIKTRQILQTLNKARDWTQKGQRGDVNGAKSYQADKYLGDGIQMLSELIERDFRP